ncbi:MAG: hypothetical protein E2598_04995 [Sphingobium sp.]|nr:hypothetical protein [Sphingobium sp.]
MKNHIRLFGVGALALGLSACVSAPAGQGPGKGPGRAGPLPPPPAMQYSKPQALTGLDAKDLIARFGTPRLDIHDRTVRKLQFMTAGGRCVLDTYLYAAARGREPVVTHMETRLTDGRDVDPASCGIR